MRLPCLPGQRRAWLLDRLDPGSPALNLSARWRMDGAISPEQLEGACARLVARHAALRTRFAQEDGEPVRWVEPSAALQPAEVDLAGLAPADQATAATRIAEAEARAPFNLAAAPLLRITRLRLGEREAVVLVTLHRIAGDRAALARLARDFAALCNGRRTAPAPRGPDFTPAEPALRHDEDYWRGALANLRPFALHTDRPRPPVQGSRSALATLPLEPGLIAGLRDLAQRHDDSLFVATLAALFALLQRYSGETDIAVGIPAAAIGAVGEQGADAVVLRADLAGARSFTQVLARVHDAAAGASMHLGTPLERTIGLLAPAQDLSRHALFSIHYSLHPAVFDAVPGDDVRFRDLAPCATGTLYDLDFALVERDGWHVTCEYAADLYEAPTIERLLAHFANLLRAVAADATQAVAELPLLDAQELRALDDEGRRSEASYPEHMTVARLFEAQVARTPHAVAVVCGQRQQTYRQLDGAANQLAHALQARGIGADDRVAVCLDRSHEMLVALLAVLKAGAAYVPLDPGHPPARLAQVLADARPVATLTRQGLCERLPDDGSPRVLLDAAEPHAGEGVAAPRSAAGPASPAYVIYTSGSTGRPKGVQVHHRGLTNLLWSMRKQPGLASTDTLVAVTTVSFDIAALELFLPLVVGARLVIAREDEVGDGIALLALLRRYRASVMQATPATWRLLLAAGWAGDPPLRMLCGGEALPRALADALMAHRGELWNLYGPTETTIWSSALRVEPGTGPVPIGPPIANTQFHVLDAGGERVPDGVPGELYIGGDGVAAGYVNLPELTHERFVPDPFRPGAGARLYRTGDRVRRLPRGRFEFLGRGDHQVKLRGFRIELGEIEAVLRAHPQVADCVALAGPDASGEPALQAWVVARGAPPATLVDALRASLRLALPAYMCPAVIALLPALPRMPNGKLDRAALPSAASLGTAPAPGRAMSVLERRLARLWIEVLGADRARVDDNFFEVGGHSLLAVRLLARIEAEFGRTLTLAALFRHPTIAAQALLLEHGDARAFDFRQVVRLQAGGTRAPLIAINNTGIYYPLSRRLGAEQPFTSLQLFDPALPRADLPRTLRDIATGYTELIRRVQPAGPYALLGWCVAGTLAFEVARQLRRAGHEVSRLILFDTLAPGHLRRLSWPRARLADYAYRWQLIAADWRRVRRGEGGIASFLSKRTAVIRLKALLGGAPATAPAALDGFALQPPPRVAEAEQYDQWLLRYLEEAANSYEPGTYPGRMTLFRSAQEPAGRFIDPLMGWQPFVTGGIDLVLVDGDHFSMFQEPGVSELAHHIEESAHGDRH